MKYRYEFISEKRRKYVFSLSIFMILFYIIGIILYLMSFSYFVFHELYAAWLAFLAGTYFFTVMIMYHSHANNMFVIDRLDWIRFRNRRNYERFREKGQWN